MLADYVQKQQPTCLLLQLLHQNLRERPRRSGRGGIADRTKFGSFQEPLQKQRVALEHYRHPFLCIFFTSRSASVSSACFRASRSRRARFSQSHSRDAPIPNAATATSRRPRRMVGSSTFDPLRDALIFRDSRNAFEAGQTTFDVRLSRQRLDRAARQRPAQRHHAGQFRVLMLDPDMLAVRLKRCRNARRQPHLPFFGFIH